MKRVRPPAPPIPLDGDALAEWKRVLPVLREAGLLATADLNLVALYCKLLKELQPQFARLSDQLGLSPAARARLKLDEAPAADETDRALDDLAKSIWA